MAIEVLNGYIELATAKQMLDIESDSSDDALALAINAASRQIDGHTGRIFYSVGVQTRYYTAQSPRRLDVDDFGTIQAIGTDEDGDLSYEYSWSVTDYQPILAEFGFPSNAIEVLPTGRYTFPMGTNAVAVSADFGWSAPPDDIRFACLLLATRLFKRKDAPFGVIGGGELGQIRAITKIDPDVKELLRKYRKVGMG
jgi:hypothetical protein